MKAKLLFIVLSVCTCLGFSQERLTSPKIPASSEVQKKISETLTEYDLIDVNIPEFLSSISSQKETRLIWNIGETKTFDMQVHPTKITSPSFEAEIVNESGNRLTLKELDFVTYKGYLDNNDAVRLTIDDDFLYGS